MWIGNPTDLQRYDDNAPVAKASCRGVVISSDLLGKTSRVERPEDQDVAEPGDRLLQRAAGIIAKQRRTLGFDERGERPVLCKPALGADMVITEKNSPLHVGRYPAVEEVLAAGGRGANSETVAGSRLGRELSNVFVDFSLDDKLA
jgi:hypothetical protein